MRLTTRCNDCHNNFACCSKCGYPEPNLEAMFYCPHCGTKWEHDEGGLIMDQIQKLNELTSLLEAQNKKIRELIKELGGE